MPRHLRAQRLGDGGPGVQVVHVHATWAVMAGGMDLAQMFRLARPAHAPALQQPDRIHALFAQQARQRLAAQAAARAQRVFVVMAPMVFGLLAQRGGHRHLRHDGRAAAADQAAVGQHHPAARLRGCHGGAHARRARADHQDVGVDIKFAHHAPRYAFCTAASAARSAAAPCVTSCPC
ncbi:hypothetical protein D3C87_1678600 [compost metagenome]